MEKISPGATYGCLKNKKVMRNCHHASILDEPHPTHLIAFCVDSWLCDEGRAACFDFMKAFNNISHSIFKAKLVK